LSGNCKLTPSPPGWGAPLEPRPPIGGRCCGRCWADGTLGALAGGVVCAGAFAGVVGAVAGRDFAAASTSATSTLPWLTTTRLALGTDFVTDLTGTGLVLSGSTLAVDANEGCDIADFDGDGKLDVSAGRNWFRNGEWVPRPVRMIEDRDGYVRSNGEWAYDINKDGRPDIISMDFFEGGVYWYENPGLEALMMGHLWPKRLLTDTGWKNNEVSFLIDLNDDGVPEWHANQWNKKNPSIIWSLSSEEREVAVMVGGERQIEKRQMPTLKEHFVGALNGHGAGFGDINNDGRKDLVFEAGWYEHPDGDPFTDEWIYHDDWYSEKSACPMLVVDMDGDGVNDLLNSSAHGYGLYYWRGLGQGPDGKLRFDKKVIDDTVSQYHCLHLADLDGDGVDELVTGKRVRAHNGKDPGGDEPPGMYYYVWSQENESFTRYTIDYGNVGIGLQIRTADIDADGDIDIVVAGKEGTQILFNRRNSL